MPKSRSATISEPANLHSVAVLITGRFGQRPEPLDCPIKLRDRRSTRHHEHVFNRRIQSCYHLLKFFELIGRANHELQLVVPRRLNQSPHGFNRHAALFMKLIPLRVLGGVGRAVCQLRAERKKITRDRLVDRSGRFDGKVKTH